MPPRSLLALAAGLAAVLAAARAWRLPDLEPHSAAGSASSATDSLDGAAHEDHLTTRLNDIVARYKQRGAAGVSHDVRPHRHDADYHVHYIVHKTPHAARHRLLPDEGHGPLEGIGAEEHSLEETRERDEDESSHAERAVDAGRGQHEAAAAPSPAELLHQRGPAGGGTLHETELKLEPPAPPAPPAAVSSSESSGGPASEEQAAAAGLYSDDGPSLEASADSAQYLFEEPALAAGLGGPLVDQVVVEAGPAPAAPADCVKPTKELRPACEDCDRSKSYTLMFLFNK